MINLILFLRDFSTEENWTVSSIYNSYRLTIWGKIDNEVHRIARIEGAWTEPVIEEVDE